MIWAVGLLAPLELPALIKVAAVLVIVSPLLLPSYQYAVRATLLGERLNGVRSPRSLPAPARAAVPSEE